MTDKRLRCRACGGQHASQKELMACHKTHKAVVAKEAAKPIKAPQEGKHQIKVLDPDKDFVEYVKLPVRVKTIQWRPPMEVKGLLTGDKRPPVYLDEKGKERAFAADQAWLPTLEGGHVVTSGDWIIQGVEGELYPCKDSIFKKTYKAYDPNEKPQLDVDDQGKFYMALGLCPEELGYLSPGQFVAIQLYGFMEPDRFRVENVSYER